MPVCHKQNDQIVIDLFFYKIYYLFEVFEYFACILNACGGQKVLNPLELEVGILVYGGVWD